MAAIVGDAEGAAICAECAAPIDVLADLAGNPPANTGESGQRRRFAEPACRPPGPPSFVHSRARLDHIGRRLEALGQLAASCPPRPSGVLPSKRVASDSALTSAALRNWAATIGLFLGVATLACGIALSVWALLSNQALLWQVGLPTALVGQFLLLAALASLGDFRGRKTGTPPADVLAAGARAHESRMSV